ncbi:MAG TPA: GNAT family N-acetyltransferase [Candidatus Saccharimonadales bacterium]|nr:GNAT family N-acetyltransferase [Candidatus Saccharimonadales bacterium]
MNVTIRPLKEEDARTSVKWRNMPELWTYTTFKADHEITIEDELKWIRAVIKDPTSARFAIMADDDYVGNIYLTGLTKETGEYHIFIGNKAYWGKGIARKASELIIDYGREKLGLKTIILGVKPANVAAFHLYESLGFIKTGEEEGFTRMKLSLAG